ncbi:hypothetical protein NQ317_013454 [Molorchus minor]|uniref:Uncharacterized protein n=1 Tax=Molorchus minor TaxID=1323400 RepID=A0ABQ9J758_9CUCU|nr:hypothetical protein NQ317_013454 [Molorchus minor]
MHPLTVMQWNIRSFNCNRVNLINFIHIHKPDVILLNETWLKENYRADIRYYTNYRVDRSDGKGGVATYIKKSIKHEQIKTTVDLNNTKIQSICIKIGTLNILNVYSEPKNKISQKAFDDFIATLSGQIMIMGDLNAHHPTWGSADTNHNGKTIMEIIHQNNLAIRNDGSSTRLVGPGEKPSPVDITIISKQLTYGSQWHVTQDCGNSDHFPTVCTINQLTTAGNTKVRRRNYKKANWDLYTELCMKQMDKVKGATDYNNLLQVMNQAANEAIPLSTINVDGTPRSPWWDDECNSLIERRKTALTNFKDDPTLENYIDAKRIRALTNRMLKKKKRLKFRKFCASLNRETDPVARAILTNLAACTTKPTFEIQSPSNNIQPINIKELTTKLQHRRDSAPGTDEVSYSMIRNLPLELTQSVLDLYNAFLREEEIPELMKEHKVVPILKANKNPTDPESYRALVMSSCILKTLESILKDRIEWQLENATFFSEFQTGFRRAHSTYDNIGYLVTYTQLAFSKNETVLATFLDIKAAYDHVNIHILYEYMIEARIPTEICNLILKILTDRKLYIVDNENNQHGPITTSTGLAQGSPLSPLLFNIYLAKLFAIVPDTIQLLSYADDLVILAKGKDINRITENMNYALEIINEWMFNHNFKVAADKCATLWFTKGRRVNETPQVKINNNIISAKNHIKYLGVTLQKNLKWDLHIEEISKKANRGIKLLKIFGKVTWGVDPATLQKVYNGIVRSQLDYGSIFLQPSSQRTLTKLDTIANQGNRIITGCMKSTPIIAILGETAEINLNHRRQWLSTKFLLKKARYESHPLLSMLTELQEHCEARTGYWRNRDAPLLTLSLRRIQTHIINMYTNKILPCYDIEYSTQLESIELLSLPINKQDTDCKQIFLKYTERYKNTHTFIFTDASKKDNKSGIGVHIPEIEYNFSARLPDNLSICSAEIAAINKACCIILEKDLKNNIIFSDSKSAIDMLTRTGVLAKAEYTCLLTKRLIIEAKESDINIVLAWIPGHSNITGNEVVDQLAKIGKELNVPLDIKLPYSDIQALLNNTIKNEFKNFWLREANTKGKWYTAIQPLHPNKPYYSELPNMSRRHITTIVRLRTGHCLHKKHLYKIGIENNPYCECGQEEDLDHILFECPINKINNFDLYQEISKSGIPLPLKTQTVLRHNKHDNLKLILTFLNHNKITL